MSLGSACPRNAAAGVQCNPAALNLFPSVNVNPTIHAGVSSAFGAPVGGILFSVEQGSSFYSATMLLHAFLAAGGAMPPEQQGSRRVLTAAVSRRSTRSRTTCYGCGHGVLAVWGLDQVVLAARGLGWPPTLTPLHQLTADHRARNTWL